MIDQQRNAGKKEETPYPGRKGINQGCTVETRRQPLWRRFAQAEKCLAQPPAGKGKATLLKVLYPQEVRQQVIAVKPHQGVEVDGKRPDPGHGRDHKGGTAHRAIGQEIPQQRGDHRQTQLDQDPACTDQQPLPSRCQSPGIGGVGKQHRKHHQQGDAMAGTRQPNRLAMKAWPNSCRILTTESVTASTAAPSRLKK